jgi:hypothetical protein
MDVLQMTNGPIPNNALNELSILSSELRGPRIIAVAPQPLGTDNDVGERPQPSRLHLLPWVLLSVFCAWTVWNVRRLDGLERELAVSNHKVHDLEESLSRSLRVLNGRVERLTLRESSFGHRMDELASALSLSSRKVGKLKTVSRASSHQIEKLEAVLSELRLRIENVARCLIATQNMMTQLDKSFSSFVAAQHQNEGKLKEWSRDVNNALISLDIVLEGLRREAQAGRSWIHRLFNWVTGRQSELGVYRPPVSLKPLEYS